MRDVIVFIDDQENVREMFKRTLSRLFGDVAEVKTIEPEANLDNMLTTLLDQENIAAYMIDENLQFSGVTEYQGVDLIEKIREIDSKVPIYIITAYKEMVESFRGDIEFLVDKVDFNTEEYQSSFVQRVKRHLQTYNDIKSERALRFEQLFTKSLSEALNEDETAELQELNIIRSKALLDESTISQKDLDELNAKTEKLNKLEEKIKGILDDE